MTTVDLITELFCRVDERLVHVSKHSQAKLCPSEVVTLALLYVLKGGGVRLLALVNPRLSALVSPLAKPDALVSLIQ